jgi:hypothetical protein
MLFGRLNGLIIEAEQQVQAFAEGRTQYFAYTEVVRTRAQQCLLDAGESVREELEAVSALDFSPSKALQDYYNRRVFNDFEAPGDPEFPRLQKEYDAQTPPKIRRMIDLLERARGKILTPAAPTRPDRAQQTTLAEPPVAQPSAVESVEPVLVRPFAMPGGSKWGDVLVRFTSDFCCQISVQNNSEVRNYVEMGFEDRRSRERNSKPDRNWEALRTFAERDGAIAATGHVSEWRKLEKRVQTINARLKTLFGFSNSGILYDRQAKAYRAQFKLVPPPEFDSA